jgi:hypothetical protein
MEVMGQIGKEKLKIFPRITYLVTREIVQRNVDQK